MRWFIFILAGLGACTGAIDTGPPPPHLLPDRVVIPGFASIEIGERFQSGDFRRLANGESIGWPFLSVGNAPLYLAAPVEGDSLERILVRTTRMGRVRCVSIQRRQTYAAAFDSLSRIMVRTPIWTDSSSAARQAIWSDGYVRWWLGGHWLPRVTPVVITVIAVEPVGKPFDPENIELC